LNYINSSSEQGAHGGCTTPHEGASNPRNSKLGNYEHPTRETILLHAIKLVKERCDKEQNLLDHSRAEYDITSAAASFVSSITFPVSCSVSISLSYKGAIE
jgi:hypothetical protein